MKTMHGLPSMGRRLAALSILVAFFGALALWRALAPEPSNSGTIFAIQALAKSAKEPSSKEVAAKEPAAKAADEKKPEDKAPAAETKSPVDLKTDEEASDKTEPVFKASPLQSLAQSLREKQRELEEKEKSLQETERRLEGLRKETANNLAKIEQALSEMQTLAGAADQQRKQEMKKWVDIYQAMPAEKAGQIMQDLDPETAMDIIAKMEPKKAAKVLSNVAPEKAVELGKKLKHKNP
jgi:flagellar motility protein MotE (MotC chaperone)